MWFSFHIPLPGPTLCFRRGQGVLVFHDGSFRDGWEDDNSSSRADFTWFSLCFDSNECSYSADGFNPIRRFKSQHLLECGRDESIHPPVGIAVRIAELIGVNRVVQSVDIKSSADFIVRQMNQSSRSDQKIILPVKFIIKLNQSNNSAIKPRNHKLDQKSIQGLGVSERSSSHHGLNRDGLCECLGHFPFNDVG